MTLDLVVHPVEGSCLWAWTIRDDGRIVESSWDSWWMAYDSPVDAEAAGRARLATLTTRVA